MEEETLIIHYLKRIRERPDLKDEIQGLWSLYCDEVADGGSPHHEASLCYDSIEDLLNE